MFVVEFTDGTAVTERQMTWDKLPDKPIGLALLINNDVIVGLVDMDEYWFSNVAVAAFGKQGKLVAQVIGGRKGDKITELEQSVEIGGKCEQYDFNKYHITQDHKPGREKDGDKKANNSNLKGIFRGFKR